MGANVGEIRGAHPFPWKQLVFPNGLVQIIDAGGVEVPLFVLTDFAMLMTNVIEAQKEAKAA